MELNDHNATKTEILYLLRVIFQGSQILIFHFKMNNTALSKR